MLKSNNGGILISEHCKKLNKVNLLGQLPIPVSSALWANIRYFRFRYLMSSFHQIKVHENKIPVKAFRAPTQLFDWLSSSALR